MAQINKPTDYFNTVLYTGNGSTQSITGVGFQPDMVWGKRRDGVVQHSLLDSVRTAQYTLFTNLTDGDTDNSPNDISSFDSDGFSLGSYGSLNASGGSHVAWNWLASNTTASNTDGSITSTVSANTTSGFSIVSYTGNGSSATVGHSLGVAPSMYIVKERGASGEGWNVYHKNLGAGNYVMLQSTNASASSTSLFDNTEPTSSVFSVGVNAGTNGSTKTYIAYCFAEKKGFSKFGSYTGNGSTDGTFIYTGFKPAFIIVKKTNSTFNWIMYDNKRDELNPNTATLLPDDSASEYNIGRDIDFLSNGFKMRANYSGNNNSGDSYIYMCFAENPLVSSAGVPCTAR